MNNYIWLENSYLLPERECGNDINSLKSRCHSARARDGKQIYIFKEGFENLPDEIKEAFKNLNGLREFQSKTWICICRDRRAENLKRLLPVDILSLIAGYLDESTKVAFVFASQLLKKHADKIDFKNVCENAARDGHLEILKWARANGALWNGLTCACAAEGGHLEVLKWARANGAPWNIDLIRTYANPEILEWLKTNP